MLLHTPVVADMRMAVIRHLVDPPGKLGILRNGHPSLATGGDFEIIEGKCPGYAKSPNRFALVKSTHSLSAIFQQGEVVFTANRQYAVEFCRCPAHMHQQYRFGFRAQCFFNTPGAEAECFVDFSKYRKGTSQKYALDRGDKCERRYDHLVAMADSGRSHDRRHRG